MGPLRENAQDVLIHLASLIKFCCIYSCSHSQWCLGSGCSSFFEMAFEIQGRVVMGKGSATLHLAPVTGCHRRKQTNGPPLPPRLPPPPHDPLTATPTDPHLSIITKNDQRKQGTIKWYVSFRTSIGVEAFAKIKALAILVGPVDMLEKCCRLPSVH